MSAQIATKPAILRKPQACVFVGLGKSTFEEMVQKGQLPKPRMLSPGCSGWLLRELEEWAEARPHSDLPPPANTGAKKGVVA